MKIKLLCTRDQVDVDQTPTKRFLAIPFPDGTPAPFTIDLETANRTFFLRHIATNTDFFIPMENVVSYQKSPETVVVKK